jgi:high-affinity Fe2+/Pb2+ permease
MTNEFQNQQALRDARINSQRQKARATLQRHSTGKNKGQAQEAIKTAKALAKSTTPWGFFSLLREGNPFMDWMYGIAIFFAILKDILDFLNLTGIGYIIVFVATICCSIIIAMAMLLGSFANGAGRAQQKMIRSWLTLLIGTTVELIPGVDFIPLETFTVLVVYFMLLADRKVAREEQEQEARSGRAQEAYA